MLYYSFFLRKQLDELRRNSAALLVNQSAAESCNQLTTNLERFSDHYAQLLKHAQDIRDRMELGLKQVEELHDHLSQMMQWLTQMERTILQQKPVSRIVARLFQLIRDHTELRKEITGHRDALINLDRLASQIQCQSQKQDVILVKNLLSSIHTRWEQLVSRSAERTRQLNTGLKVSLLFSAFFQNTMVILSFSEYSIPCKNRFVYCILFLCK